MLHRSTRNKPKTAVPCICANIEAHSKHRSNLKKYLSLVVQEKASLKNKTKPHEHVDETEETARRQSRGNDMIETNDDEEKKAKKKKQQDMQRDRILAAW